MERPFGKWLIIGLGLVIALLLFNAGVAYHNTRQMHEDAAWVIRTDETLDALDDLMSTMKDAETGQRGYLITGEEGYLKPYQYAVAIVKEKVITVQRLTSDDPHQQARLSRVQELVQTKL